MEDSNDRHESDQSGEEFFDAEHGSGNFEPWESNEPKSFEEFNVGLDEPGEATEINVAAQKENLVLASSVEPTQETKQAPSQELEKDHGSTEQASGQELEQELEQQSTQEPTQELGHKSEQQYEQQLAQEPEQQSAHQVVQELEQEDLTRNNALVLPLLEPQVTSKSGKSQELLVEEPLAIVPSTKFEELTEVNVAEESSSHDLTSTAEKPQIDNVVSSEKSLLNALSSNPELLENLEQKSSDTPITSSTPHEALEKEPLTTAPTIKNVQGHDVGKSNDMYISLEPQLEDSKETLVNESLKAIPSSESTKLVQEVGNGQSDAILASSKPQLTPTLEEPQEGFVKEPLASKSMDLEEPLVDEPLAITSAKLAQESIVDKGSATLVEESPLTPIAEEPQDSGVSSQVEGKHGQDEADQNFLEDVKIIPKVRLLLEDMVEHIDVSHFKFVIYNVLN